jgi:ubiquinone/menaquinone biosynthesis C-methylase UbiE
MSRRVKEYFDQVSSQWDNMRKSFYGEEVREAVLNAAQISPDDTVLDVGAGTGFLTQGAAMIARKVIAIDFSRGMSDESIAKLGKGKVEFRIGNVERMQLLDSSVDVVIGNMVLHHCPHPETAIAEMARVLKPRGRIAISDLQEHGYEWLRREHADLWLGFKMEDVLGMMKKAHLENVKANELSTCCTSTQEERSVKIPMFLASAQRQS